MAGKGLMNNLTTGTAGLVVLMSAYSQAEDDKQPETLPVAVRQALERYNDDSPPPFFLQEPPGFGADDRRRLLHERGVGEVAGEQRSR
jgi:hypothetical protein